MNLKFSFNDQNNCFNLFVLMIRLTVFVLFSSISKIIDLLMIHSFTVFIKACQLTM